MMDEIKKAVKAAVKNLFNVDIEPELTRPDEQFGDYATNVALKLAKQLNKNPKEIAETLAKELRSPGIENTSVAGGFVNIRLSDKFLLENFALANKLPTTNKGREILVEFGDANPFKAMHLGHLYDSIAGEVISRLFEATGAIVKRLSYHGDVGMHVAKCIWAVGLKTKWNKTAFEELLTSLTEVNIGHYYAEGAKAFDEDKPIAAEIKAINESVYRRDRAEVNLIYDKLRDKSFEGFDHIFKELGIKHDQRYLESEVAKPGAKIVKENIGTVFEESDGAVIFKGEKAGLHTRVFINSKGLPTYEAKDLGLAFQKNEDFPSADKSIVITATEQAEYFKVMLAALAEIDKKLAAKTSHLAHGFLSLTSGKMSSRTGNIYAAYMLLDSVREAVKLAYPDADESNQTYLAATKYAMLKNRLGSDFVFDVKESVSLEGNSGPYLQYAHARAKSILQKSNNKEEKITNLEPGERTLIRKLTEYPEVVARSIDELMPHHICTYLYELAQTFNSFYEHNRVVGDPRESTRAKIVAKYAAVLKNGLELLSIKAPDKM